MNTSAHTTRCAAGRLPGGCPRGGPTRMWGTSTRLQARVQRALHRHDALQLLAREAISKQFRHRAPRGGVCHGRDVPMSDTRVKSRVRVRGQPTPDTPRPPSPRGAQSRGRATRAPASLHEHDAPEQQQLCVGVLDRLAPRVRRVLREVARHLLHVIARAGRREAGQGGAVGSCAWPVGREGGQRDPPLAGLVEGSLGDPARGERAEQLLGESAGQLGAPAGRGR